MKDWYRGGDKDVVIPKVVTGIFGAIAGGCSVFGNTPIDVVKTRMQVNISFLKLLILNEYISVITVYHF